MKGKYRNHSMSKDMQFIAILTNHHHLLIRSKQIFIWSEEISQDKLCIQQTPIPTISLSIYFRRNKTLIIDQSTAITSNQF
jgi:hypothetical protein